MKGIKTVVIERSEKQYSPAFGIKVTKENIDAANKYFDLGPHSNVYRAINNPIALALIEFGYVNVRVKKDFIEFDSFTDSTHYRHYIETHYEFNVFISDFYKLYDLKYEKNRRSFPEHFEGNQKIKELEANLVPTYFYIKTGWTVTISNFS